MSHGFLRVSGEIRPASQCRHAGHLSLGEREEISRGRPLGLRAWAESGVTHACRNAAVIADRDYQGASLIIPHRRSPGVELPEGKGPQQLPPQGPCPC